MCIAHFTLHLALISYLVPLRPVISFTRETWLRMAATQSYKSKTLKNNQRKHLHTHNWTFDLFRGTTFCSFRSVCRLEPPTFTGCVYSCLLASFQRHCVSRWFPKLKKLNLRKCNAWVSVTQGRQMKYCSLIQIWGTFPLPEYFFYVLSNVMFMFYFILQLHFIYFTTCVPFLFLVILQKKLS